MIKIVSWILGLSAGAAVGAVIVALFVPTPAKEIVGRLRSGYQATMEEARLASQQKRAQLEAELSGMQERNKALSD